MWFETLTTFVGSINLFRERNLHLNLPLQSFGKYFNVFGEFLWVFWGCCNTDWVAYTVEMNFLLVLEAGSPKSECQHNPLWWEAFSELQIANFPFILTWCTGAKGVLWLSFIKTSIPIRRLCPYDLIISQRPQSLTLSYQGLAFQCMNCEQEDTNVQGILISNYRNQLFSLEK